MVEKKKRGGKREGAGRKKNDGGKYGRYPLDPDGSEVLHVRLPRRVMEVLRKDAEVNGTDLSTAARMALMIAIDLRIDD